MQPQCLMLLYHFDASHAMAVNTVKGARDFVMQIDSAKHACVHGAATEVVIEPWRVHWRSTQQRAMGAAQAAVNASADAHRQLLC